METGEVEGGEGGKSEEVGTEKDGGGREKGGGTFHNLHFSHCRNKVVEMFFHGYHSYMVRVVFMSS